MRTTWVAALICVTAGFAALAEAAPKIHFDRLVYDFGKTGQVETVTGTFKYTNEGDAVLKIQPPHATCGCTIASLNPDTLAPGESGELAFTLSLGQARTLMEKQITVQSNDPQTPEVSLVIRADYTPLYEVTPMILSPSLPRNGKATNLTVTLARTDGQPLRIRKLTPSQPWITATLEPDPKGDKAMAKIHVNVRADGSPRRFSEYVHLYDVDRTNAPVTMIYVYGQVLGDLTLTPEAMYWNITQATFKGEPATDAVTRRVMIRAADGKPFTLRNPKSTLADVQLKLEPRERGAAYEMVATLKAPPAQSLAGTVTFDSSVTTQPRVEIPFIVNVSKP